MKTRRSQRLLKPPIVQIKPEDQESDDSNEGKKKAKFDTSSRLDVEKTSKGDPSTFVSQEDACQEVKQKINGIEFGKRARRKALDGDSSDSSDDYMKAPIDLNSDFFKVDFKKETDSSAFVDIENKIFSDVQRLSDSAGSSDFEDFEMTHEYIPIPLPNETTKKDISNKFRKKSSKKKKEETHCSGSTEKKKKVDSDDIKLDISNMDVCQLLALGETQPAGDNEAKPEMKCKKESEDEVSDWEEVEEQQISEIKAEQHGFPKEGVQITVDAPDLYHKRREKGFDMEVYLKRRMNRVKREIQVLVHKVHLLCWIAHGLFVNSVLNSEVLMGLSLSLIPSQHCYPNTVDASYLKHLAGWFIKTVVVKEVSRNKQTFVPLQESLQKQFECSVANSKRDLVLMFVCLLRSLGLNARLVISLQPVRLKPSSNELAVVDSKKSANCKQKVKIQSPKSEDNTVTKTEPKKRGRKKVEKALSAEEAEQIKKSRKVMSKEEAAKLVKQSNGIVKEKDLKSKKLKTNDSTGVHTKQSDCKKPRRSLREKKVNAKYKDITDTSDDEDSENEPSLSCKETERNKPIRVGVDAGKTIKGNVKNRTAEREKKELSQESEEDVPAKRNRESLESNKGKQSRTPKSCPEGAATKCENLRNKNDFHAVKQNETSKQSVHSGGQASKEQKDKKNKALKIDSKRNLSSADVNQDRVSKSLDQSEKKCYQKEPGKVRKEESNSKDQNSADSADEFMLSLSQPSTSSSVPLKKETKKKEGNSESEFECEITDQILKARRSNVKRDRRVLSSDSDDENVRVKNNFWVEVLLDDKTWITLNVLSGNVDCIRELCNNASKPVTYVVAWNVDNTLKDVTRRYCPKFHSETRKLRVEEEWWKESLFPFQAPRTAMDRKEDKDMEKQIQKMPLPSSIGEYKNHPLYVLKRHLLKFQAIYPPDAPTLGFVRGEPVYARECVYTLHSREIWVKEAKVVRPGEQPYKIVKARPKYDRMSGKVMTDIPLEIFGIWQVEDYVPPTAVDGKVPRNAYGNVELFKSCMLPKGTVHLQVPALNRVAKKLGIDCAPAVVGFDFHCGASHPVYDGFVVCEEFEDVLLDAWNREQEEAARREQEKREKRVYGNWRRLIKGLMIRERLNLKYSFGEEENEKEAVEKKAPKSKSSVKAKGKPPSKKLRKCSGDDSDWEDV